MGDEDESLLAFVGRKSGDVILSSTLPDEPSGQPAPGSRTDKGGGGGGGVRSRIQQDAGIFDVFDGFSADIEENGMPVQMQEDGHSSKSLVVGDGLEAADIHGDITKVTMDHEVYVVTIEKAYEFCNDFNFHLIWILADLAEDKDAINLSAFIRYGSKNNQNTTVIGVSSHSDRADSHNRLDTVDDVIMRPVTRTIIMEVYTKWTSVQLTNGKVETEDNDKSCIHRAAISMPTTPANLSTPATPVSASDDMDRSSFSISEDSGIESPPNLHLPNGQQLSSVQPMLTQTHSDTAKMKAADHTTKEKLRRERIKDSCDQLRVLLPYIRGRKTDMASILEMCVDYLQIVNGCMPQTLQDQIVDVLSKDPSLVPNTEAQGQKKGQKKDTKQPSNDFVLAHPSTGDCRQATSGVQPQLTVSSTLTARKPAGSLFLSSGPEASKPIPSKRELIPNNYESKATKRMCGMSPVTTDLLLGESNVCPSLDTVSMQPVSVHPLSQFDPNRTDNNNNNNGHCSLVRDNVSQLGYPMHTHAQISNHCNTKNFTEMDPNYGRPYGPGATTLDTFTPSQLYSNYVTAKNQTLERENFPAGMYMDSSLYQYYGSIHSNPASHLYTGQDYVNPNSVLPMYNPVSTTASSLLTPESTESISIDSHDSDIISPGSP